MKSCRSVLLCSLLIPCTSVFAADLDQNLVARWTFNDPTFFEQNLQSDTGAHKFRQIQYGSNPDCTFDGSTMTLGPGCLLVCDSLSSAENPKFSGAVTIWARLRLEKAPKADCFTFGFRSAEQPADWPDMVLVAVHRPQPQNATGFLARFLDRGTQLSSGARNLLIEPGRWATVALVFNGTERTVTYIVDGKAVTGGHPDGTSLAAFSNFSLGRLKEAGGSSPLVFDEVRIYSVALSPEWIGEIQPVKEGK